MNSWTIESTLARPFAATIVLRLTITSIESSFSQQMRISHFWSAARIGTWTEHSQLRHRCSNSSTQSMVCWAVLHKTVYSFYWLLKFCLAFCFPGRKHGMFFPLVYVLTCNRTTETYITILAKVERSRASAESTTNHGWLRNGRHESSRKCFPANNCERLLLSLLSMHISPSAGIRTANAVRKQCQCCSTHSIYSCIGVRSSQRFHEMVPGVERIQLL